ncbi:MAG: UDP-N-acetylglucosamine 2-epimerase, partial [Candidatus Marinimicrobia bacterium]|nr:UDP-N-acetylglucosamine 2-epimerase [Candidatus Neomarinimicrobiota bacterium]
LLKLVEALITVSTSIPCVFPIHPRTKNKLEHFGLLDQLNDNPNFFLTEPLGYIDFMALQKRAAVILTDSGGVQEESTSFGVPCLTIRDNTERPITCTQGTNKLIGTDYSVIPDEVKSTLNTPIQVEQKPDLWDGKAAERLADVIDDYL